MRLSRSWLLASALVVALATAPLACGADDEAATSTTGSRDFRGVLVADDGTDGVFELRATTRSSTAVLRPLAQQAITLSGSVSLGSGVSADLTGTFDPATNTLTASGTARTGVGTFSFAAEYRDGRLSGTWTGPGGLSGSIAALPITLEPVMLYCGPFSGGRQGRMNLATSGSLAGGVATFGAAQAVLLSGSVVGGALRLTYPNGGQVEGTASSGEINGTWRDSGGDGTFVARTSGCPTLVPSTSDDGGVNPDGNAPLPDGGELPTTALELASEQTFVDFVEQVGDYVVYASLEGRDVRFVRKDGTGKDVIMDACAVGGCRGVVVQGTKITFWDVEGAVKQFTPPNKVLASLGTVTTSPNDARADERYVWFKNQGEGGFMRFDTTGSNSSNFPGESIGGYDLFDGFLYYTSQSSPDHAFRRFKGDFSELASNYTFYGQISPDNLPTAAGADSLGSVFLTTQRQSASSVRLWNVNASIETALVSTLPTTIASKRPLLDTANVYLVDNGPGGKIVSVPRSARGITGSTPVADFSSPIAAFVQDASFFYVAEGRKVHRQPKPARP